MTFMVDQRPRLERRRGRKANRLFEALLYAAAVGAGAIFVALFLASVVAR